MDPHDRQRKDRLIQTRVPQNLESTLKDEARKRRLSVSHLIRNVLEDTFNLVDNVVSEVDRVVSDSVEMAQTLKRDAQRLAATARGETAHREPTTVELEVEAEAAPEPPQQPEQSVLVTPPPAARADLSSGPLASVFGFQELVLNRPAECAACKAAIARGSRAYLGMTDAPGPRVWVCQDCIGSLSP